MADLKMPKPGDQVPLHLANLQARAIDRARNDDADKVGAAASQAARDTLKGIRTRTQKPLRPVEKPAGDGEKK